MQFASTAKVNSLFYISTLRANESYIIQDTLRYLKPFFAGINLPFADYSIDSKKDLISLLDGIRIASEGGLLPMIHIIGHGAQGGGLGIADANEMLYWDELSEILRSINIACGNNLCIIASSCFGFEVIEDTKITEAVPFYLLIAPEEKLQFSYFVESTKSLYESIFSGVDIIDAYEKHASKQMTLFHCEKMLATVFAKYIVNSCRGEGRNHRLDHLVELALKGGRFADTPETRKMLRALADTQIGPTQEQLDKYASTFLVGQPAGFNLEDLLNLIDPSTSKEQ